ncbi:nitroreductase family protein [Flavobacterium macacae]|uniref:NAD(P)H-dependent oxidoreductase n=1 Tax=Flavobacterium macacae TaxID=2488993 RepID=A0A3P3W695_9FLAO|nr:nitroreductase family protein [Flavobacterium macacae]RRJ89506.1 NAD(P)H-dependent oxidoreductase [Flavobacterium macacae]
MQFIEDLKWRYASKAMNGKKIDESKINNILESIILAPTSSGLQPFEILVVKNSELKEKIKPLAFNQSVITECSHLLVFAVWDNYTEERINHAFEVSHGIRGFNQEWDNYRKRLLEMYVVRPAQENFEHAARQAYIAFGFAIATAATERVDSTPIEGFNPEAVDALLELKEKGLRSVLLLPLGYRDEQKDWLVDLKKVRKPKAGFITDLD